MTRSAGAPVALALLVPALTAGGQAPAVTLAPATVVRIDAPALGLRRARAEVVAQRGDTLTLLRGAPDAGPRRDTLSVRLTSLTRLDVARPRRRALWGAAAGAAVGALAVGVAGYTMPTDPVRCTLFYCSYVPRGSRAAQGALYGGLFGAGVGLLAGRFVPARAWRRVLPAA
jgi:hypothetical protein